MYENVMMSCCKFNHKIMLEIRDVSEVYYMRSMIPANHSA
jgi:hypothetical protein